MSLKQNLWFLTLASCLVMVTSGAMATGEPYTTSYTQKYDLNDSVNGGYSAGRPIVASKSYVDSNDDKLNYQKQEKVRNATAGNLATWDSGDNVGNTKDSGKSFDAANNTLTTTAGNGNMIPTSAQVIGYVGTATNDMATQTWVGNQHYLTSSDISGKQDKPQSATANNIATFDANKNNIDSGNKFDTASGTLSTTNNSNLIPTSEQVIGYVAANHQDISGKQDKISGATAGDITTTNAAGQTQDSGNKFDTASGTLSTTNNSNLIPTSAQVIGYVAANHQDISGKQTKPSVDSGHNVLAGQVLTYTTSNSDPNSATPKAQYVKIPVSTTGEPSDTNNTAYNLASVWVQ